MDIKINPLVGFSYRTFNSSNSSLQLAPTLCCAVSVLKGLNDSTPESDIKEVIQFHDGDHHNCHVFGQRNILAFAHEHEKDLQKTLSDLGFRRLADDLPRRAIYSQTPLVMFMYSR